MGERRNNEGPGGYVDNRSVNSTGRVGGRIVCNTTNEGPRPGEISRSASESLVQDLRKRDPEKFQISWMMDVESGEPGTMLVSWLRRVDFDPQVNKGEQQFRIQIMRDEFTTATHIVVGVLPR